MVNHVSLDLATHTRAADLIGTAWRLFRPKGLRVTEASKSVLIAAQRSHQGRVKHIQGNGLSECCRTAHDLMRANRVFQRDDGGLDHEEDYTQSSPNHRLNMHILFLLGNLVYNHMEVSKDTHKKPDSIYLPQRAPGYDWKGWIKSPSPWPRTQENHVTLEGLVLSELLQAWQDVYGDQYKHLRWHNIALLVLNEIYRHAETFEEIYNPKILEGICNSIYMEMCLQKLWEEENNAFLHAGDGTFKGLPLDKQERIMLLVVPAISAISDFVNPEVK